MASSNERPWDSDPTEAIKIAYAIYNYLGIETAEELVAYLNEQRVEDKKGEAWKKE